MRAREVMNILEISRPTLSNYVRDGKITGQKGHNGRFKYDKESVERLLSSFSQKINVIYCQSESERNLIFNHCELNKIKIDEVYCEGNVNINSFDKRDELFKMLESVFEGKINNIYVSSRQNFCLPIRLANFIFGNFETNIKFIK